MATRRGNFRRRSDRNRIIRRILDANYKEEGRRNCIGETYWAGRERGRFLD